MDIRHLEYFFEVAKHLNFTKAAQSLHVSQPSLSKTIKNLENELDVSLIYRSAKQIKLTDAGEAFFINTKHVLGAFNNLTSEINELMQLKKGEIKIGIPPIIGASFFSKLISHFKDAYPLVDIKLREVGTKTIKQEVKNESLDIGLICNLPADTDEFGLIEMDRDPLMVIINCDNPLASNKTMKLSYLKNESFILYRNDFSLYDRIISECLQNQFTPDIVCESSQKEFMVEMTGAKLGIALLPSRICQDITHPNIVSLPLENSDLHLDLGMIWKKDRYLSFAVREFISKSKEIV
ncbi:LysR family transcriptional regulator [Lentibacillus halophilus]|uniref:LysR family transcriptional regulator n=1 Tax=Lentibacillus halophilus TaxID=295065 RepID=A0ABN0ZH15_9BACI